MPSTVRNFLLIIGALVVGTWLLKLVFGWVLSIVWGVIVPLAIVGGILYGGYVVFGRKALDGSRRTLP